jgi:deoxyribodipyrimidine photo-lyase
MAERGLVWFRSDLRVHDNPALYRATLAHAPAGVVGLFVLSPGEWAAHDAAPAKVLFTLACVRELSAALAKLHIPLLVRHAPTAAEVPGVVLAAARQAQAGAIHFSREYEVNEQRRDEQVLTLAAAANISVVRSHGQVMLPPGEVLTQGGKPYTVFTPFKRSWLAQWAARSDERAPLPAPARQKPLPIAAEPVPERLEGFPCSVDMSLWPAGEAAALKRLEAFCTNGLMDYKARRDLPAVSGTSALSPYLTSGALSPRTAMAMAQRANGGSADGGREGAATWMSELIWREFYKHVLAQFPRVCMHRPFKAETARLKWEDNPAHLEAWQQGRTGFPIVDAAQRQLLATGWMHNRLRMITAMFFTKDLLLDWRLGERHFMRCLIDGDLSANNGGWQWSAGTGTDAAPYFRIFNPTSQSEKFDPDGAFIRTWVPELASVSGKAIHDPPPLLRARLGYPAPIVDHAKARDRTLKAWKALKA